jgi:predicted RNase H-like HicB family nuclease
VVTAPWASILNFFVFASAILRFCGTPPEITNPRHDRAHTWRDGSNARLVLVSAGAYDNAMNLNLTAVFQKVPEGYIGFVEELPGANTQAATLEEARANLREAVALVLEANRELVQETTQGGEVIRESLKVGM